MKILLISYYWYPYNNSGTFRWVNFSKHMDFDVLTCRKPRKSFKDYSIVSGKYYEGVYRFGAYLPAVAWGFIAPFIALFMKYDFVIVTCPPESGLFGAWILQLFGKKVLVDMRDSIDRERQPLKRFINIYKFLYSKIINVIVASGFFDPSKPIIYSGYEDIKGTKFVGYYQGRVARKWYRYNLECGLVPDQSNKPSGYWSGSAQTLRHLGYPINNVLHEEFYSHELQSIKQSTEKLKTLIYEMALDRN